MTPRYPHIKLQLTGEDGNGLAILARAMREARAGGISVEERDAFNKEALSGDYDHLLHTCMVCGSTAYNQLKGPS